MSFTVLTPNEEEEEVLLNANGACCQLGMCCPCPCGPCAKVYFPVSDAKSGVEVAMVTKVVPSCLKFLFAEDVDNFLVEFRDVQNPDWKALLIGLALFIDFRYFNEQSPDHDM